MENRSKCLAISSNNIEHNWPLLKIWYVTVLKSWYFTGLLFQGCLLGGSLLRQIWCHITFSWFLSCSSESVIQDVPPMLLIRRRNQTKKGLERSPSLTLCTQSEMLGIALCLFFLLWWQSLAIDCSKCKIPKQLSSTFLPGLSWLKMCCLKSFLLTQSGISLAWNTLLVHLHLSLLLNFL